MRNAWLNVNFALGTCGEKFAVNKKRLQSCWEASPASQTQPATLWIAFRILSTLGGGWIWLTKSCPCWGWLARLHGGCHVYNDIWEVDTKEQLLCQRENGNHAGPFAVEVTLGSSTLNKRYWAHFFFGRASVLYTFLSTSSALTRGRGWEREPCGPRALQVAKKSHNKT